MTSKWKSLLKEELSKPYLRDISNFVSKARETKNIYPASVNVLRVLDLDYDDVKVVIIGQDPYPTAGDADGLAFSASNSITVPKSLKRILQAVEETVEGAALVQDPDLFRWHKQGVFLLNTVLTVEEAKPLSHSKIGWQSFTGYIVKLLSLKENMIFVLWGKEAQNFAMPLLQPDSHVIIAEHPVAGVYDGNRPWLHNDCFNQVNAILKSYGKREIEW